MINPYRVGKTVLFQVTYDRDWHLFESVPFFFISVFGVNDINFRLRLLIRYVVNSDCEAILTMLNIYLRNENRGSMEHCSRSFT